MKNESKLPCAIEKFWKFLQNPLEPKKYEEKFVTFLDARKNNPGDFHETGFTLVELDNELDIKDWRTPVQEGEKYRRVNLKVL